MFRRPCICACTCPSKCVRSCTVSPIYYNSTVRAYTQHRRRSTFLQANIDSGLSILNRGERIVTASRDRIHARRKLCKCRHIARLGDRPALVGDGGLQTRFSINDRLKIFLQRLLHRGCRHARYRRDRYVCGGLLVDKLPLSVIHRAAV